MYIKCKIKNPARPKISHWNHFNDKADREVITKVGLYVTRISCYLSFLFAQHTFTSDWVPSECKLIKQDSDALTLLKNYRTINIYLNKFSATSWN